MPRVSYVNGQYVPHAYASVHIEDRGYQFADGVYEVIAVIDGRLIDETPHLDRLDRSLRELSMAWPVSRRALKMILRRMVRLNRIVDGKIYLQVTRGVAARDFAFPDHADSALVITAGAIAPFDPSISSKGVAVISVPDQRWARRDIKSIGLLPAALGKQKAVEAGAFEAWMVDDEGFVTEGTSSNAWIVTSDGVLVTRHANSMILSGVTRGTVIQLAAEAGFQFEERPFTIDEAKIAREAFVTSSTAFMRPVVQLDGVEIGGGMPGDLTIRLLHLYADYMKNRGDRP